MTSTEGMKKLIEHVDSMEGLERRLGCNLNDVLFGSLCKTIGYSGLSGKDKIDELE